MKNRYVYLVILISILSVVFLLNIIVNYFVSLNHPTFVDVVGSVDTWITFNAIIVGSTIGGLVAGFIAFRISKMQLENQNRNEENLRSLKLKQELTIDLNKQLLSLASDILDNLHILYRHYKAILRQINQYKSFIETSNVVHNETVREMEAFLEKNFAEFDRYCIIFFDTNLKLDRIYRTYTIVLMEHKGKIEGILSNLINIGNNLEPLKLAYKSIVEVVKNNAKISESQYEEMKGIFNEIVDVSNNTYGEVVSLNIDIQNTFEYLFDTTIEQPQKIDPPFNRI